MILDSRGYFDSHVHTSFSPDSRQPMQGHCARAVQLGLDGVCFTEHLDFDPLSLGYYRPEAYFDEISRLREQYDGRLVILSGLELSEPHRHPRELEQAQKRPYDFILGSVHYWLGGLFPREMCQQGMDASRCYARYWEHVLQMVQCGGFDAVGHLDFPKRYFKCLEYTDSMLDEIFRTMQKNGLVLEINTSSLRCGLDEPMPGKALLQRCIARGGRYVTLGSDAHYSKDLGTGLPQARALAASLHLQPVHFVQRKMVAEQRNTLEC